MVSRILKKIASKKKPMSMQRCRCIRRRHRRHWAIKKAATASSSSVVLSRIGSKKGIKILQYKTRTRETPPESGTGRPLQPLTSPEKRTVFLDLDETLIHAVTGMQPKRYDFVVRPKIRGKVMTFYVAKRPGVDAFLAKLAAKYEVVVFTAGLKEYATLVLDRLDRNQLISHRLYRDACTEVNGKFVKNLAGLGRDLQRLVIVDDNPNAYCFQPENAVPVMPFYDDVADRELERLLEFFEKAETRSCEDIRNAVKQFCGDDGLTSTDDDDDGSDDDECLVMKDANCKIPILTVSPACSFFSLHKREQIGVPIFDFWAKFANFFSIFMLFVMFRFRTGVRKILKY